MDNKLYDTEPSCNDSLIPFILSLILAIFTLFVIYLIRPDCVQKCDENGQPTDTVDFNKLALLYLVITIILYILVWIFFQVSPMMIFNHIKK